MQPRQSSYRIIQLAYVVSTMALSVLAYAPRVEAQAGAQPNRPTAPEGLKGLNEIDTHLEPSLDLPAIEAEDEIRAIEGMAPRFAIPRPVSITPNNAGTWENFGADRRVWRLRITSPGAISMNLGFTHYKMPPGGELWLYTSDGLHATRPFTSTDNADHNQLWTPILPSDDIVVEVRLPAALVTAMDLELGSVNVGYRTFGETLQGNGFTPRSGSCNVDVVCPEGDPWEDEINSVGVISTGGSTFCTGCMLNNARQDRKPFFLTANHCGINSGNAASLVVYWNYQNSTCRPVNSGASGGAGDGSLTQFNTGSFFRAASSPSDFTLVELDEEPNSAWNVTFAGWSKTGAESPSGTCIHHPNTDEKRITFYATPTTTTSYNNPAVPGDGTHVHATWSLGVTEPGSSGSPLFDSNHRVIGQLHGGPSACAASDKSDYYGRFSVSWTGGGTNATRLSNWLDPDATGATAVDTIGGGLTISPIGNVLSEGPSGGPFTNPSTVYTISNSTGNSANYEVSLGAGSAPALIDGGTSMVSGTLADGANVNVTVTYDASANSLAAGIYTRDILFNDTTNSKSEMRTHTLEINQNGFTTTPAGGLVSGGPVGGPFPATIVYTLTSNKPAPVNIQVVAGAPWISLNGGAGPLNINLPTNGSSTNVTVGFSAAANSLTASIYNSVVNFTNLSGGSGSTGRPVTLDVGRYTYPSTDTPRAINDNSSFMSTINVTDSYCIADVNVPVDITHTYIGDLVLDLQSPSGTVVRLHNRSGGDTDNIVKTYDDPGTPADGPGSLADFIGESVTGIWKLTVADQASQDVGTLNSWSLKIAAGAATCPTRQTIVSFPLTTNPGWTTGTGWAFGTPTGAAGDPNSGFTGSNVYGYNLSGAYTNNIASTRYLTTTAMNCTGYTGVRVEFRRWLGCERSTYDHVYVDVSTNGTTWTNIWQNPDSSINDTSWSLQQFNISGIADNAATVYVRWGLGPTDSSVTYQGWNLDDIQLTGYAAPVAGDIDADGDVDNVDRLIFVDVLLGLDTNPDHKSRADMVPDGSNDGKDIDPFLNALL